ncbi:conserved hypothetical protein [Candidatus Desulfarcum epimagneticum]|uniref:Nucleotidyl transferase AbiEii/AbiGii toxin family protein n=1 Tax=uncultured Desulfobacteraceae bacterium TaxID=218296 RepID=A0A484HHN8_9BACT|nr:conserved hypothetical protein [uncultured Desulfobacteraceae bacterium]
MDIFKRHEIFEIETLKRLKAHHLLEPLAFGGGTMLRLCHELSRYSADLDFWFVKERDYEKYFDKMAKALGKDCEITDSQIKFHTLLFEIRSPGYPRRLKIEIRKQSGEFDFQDQIAFSRHSVIQVIVRAFTLEQMMKNKTAALADRGEIRDGFDIEFLLRKGVALPDMDDSRVSRIERAVKGFKPSDFKVKLGSILESDMRKYHVENGFGLLEQKIRSLQGRRSAV